MMRRSLTMFCVACGLAVARPATGEDLKFSKVDVSDGQVLFLVRPEDGKGNYSDDRRSRIEEAVYLFDPSRHKSPQPFWRGENPPFRPVTMSFGELLPTTARPLPHLLIVERSSLCAIVDLRTGNAEPLDDEHETEVVAVEGVNVYYLQRTIPYEYGGFQLNTERGVTITEAYHRPRDFLFVRNVGEAKSRRLCDTLIERILAVESDGFWVVTAGKDRKLARISREGRFEEFAAFDDHWVAPLTRHAFSPKRKYMAISTVHDRHDFHKESELLVIDLEKKAKAFAMERVNLELTGLPGALGPSLSMGWLDDAHLWIHRLSPRIIDIPKGAELEIDAAARLARAQPQPKIEPRRKTTGLFDHEWGLLYFKGDAKPIASMLNEFGFKTSDMEIAPGGEWAAYSKDGLWLVSGKAKHTTRILEGWTYDLAWLDCEAK